MILADTGFFVALANPRDRFHRVATGALRELRDPLVTTWPVLTETCHLLLGRLGADAQERFLAGITKGAARVLALEDQHLPRIAVLMKKYRALPMDLADASLVVAAEELGHGRILSTDQRDFGAYRWKNRKPFRNLLPEPT
ncbi:MAG: PIN domain-containing protein [Sandaracinaceae bacterium]|nr:PIN domain-containing protein [Sandaracinaceae bacterium]